ncbi:HD domain-containing phosphohydrolase [Psychromonas ossibalaenae]|uniref:HD domain-containing phosphohydrolase n=1 Tax=Psychromonas ossibalaenae TaxID=444922 RepID=UPI000382EBC9|nr:HD domain-containing phosphohydrolase [Psychromonas ossibalaenae]
MHHNVVPSIAGTNSFNQNGRADLNNHRQVLIVDDQSTGRMILGKIIQQIADDIKVVDFDDPEKALEWLRNNPVDLIVTDYKMPGLNGIEFIKEVRRIKSREHIPIMMITVVSEKAVRYEALEAGATAFLTRPIDQIECRTSCRNLLKLHKQHVIIQNRANWLAQQVHVATEQIIQREQETILRLAKAGEYRDEETGNHVIRMAKYSRKIAEELGLSEQECIDLEHAAQMHDIGKIGIADYVLLKPGKLNDSEWEIMKTHTTIGYEILSNSQSKYMQLGAVIALNHHERFDGQGYPSGLKGEEIPLIARIVSVADVFDALLSVRPYKAAWPVENAIDFIKKQAGTQFDPQCVDAFCKRLAEITQIQIDYPDHVRPKRLF